MAVANKNEVVKPGSAMTIDFKNLLERSLPNCAKAFNMALVLFIIRVPLSIFSRHLEFTLVGLAVLGLSLAVAGLVGYLAFQGGFHPMFAVVLPVGLLLPYGGTLILIFILILSRIFLQRNGYVVGLTKARKNPVEAAPWPDIPFRKHVPWLIIFGVIPWVAFILLWIVNPDYMGKVFTPSGHWLGLLMLLTALVSTVLTYPLSIQFQLLRTTLKSTGVIKVQIGMVVSLAVLFALISIGIFILTPAAITMTQQMANAR